MYHLLQPISATSFFVLTIKQSIFPLTYYYIYLILIAFYDLILLYIFFKGNSKEKYWYYSSGSYRMCII